MIADASGGARRRLRREVAGGALVTLAAAAALIPLAARIYTGAVLRTGSRIGLRAAWRAAPASTT